MEKLAHAFTFPLNSHFKPAALTVAPDGNLDRLGSLLKQCHLEMLEITCRLTEDHLAFCETTSLLNAFCEKSQQFENFLQWGTPFACKPDISEDKKARQENLLLLYFCLHLFAFFFRLLSRSQNIFLCWPILAVA
jgi:hypothetical protein